MLLVKHVSLLPPLLGSNRLLRNMFHKTLVTVISELLVYYLLIRDPFDKMFLDRRKKYFKNSDWIIALNLLVKRLGYG